jgi:hypothetical protein
VYGPAYFTAYKSLIDKRSYFISNKISGLGNFGHLSLYWTVPLKTTVQ